MTLCVPLLGGASLVPCSRTKKASHSPVASILLCRRRRDGDIATGDVHVRCSDGACACAAASLNRWLYRYALTRSSCLSPKPETLNPETESDTSGAGPGPGPPAARECETEQTCELCVGKPHRQL